MTQCLNNEFHCLTSTRGWPAWHLLVCLHGFSKALRTTWVTLCVVICLTTWPSINCPVVCGVTLTLLKDRQQPLVSARGAGVEKQCVNILYRVQYPDCKMFYFFWNYISSVWKPHRQKTFYSKQLINSVRHLLNDPQQFKCQRSLKSFPGTYHKIVKASDWQMVNLQLYVFLRNFFFFFAKIVLLLADVKQSLKQRLTIWIDSFC